VVLLLPAASPVFYATRRHFLAYSQTHVYGPAPAPGADCAWLLEDVDNLDAATQAEQRADGLLVSLISNFSAWCLSTLPFPCTVLHAHPACAAVFSTVQNFSTRLLPQTAHFRLSRIAFIALADALDWRLACLRHSASKEDFGEKGLSLFSRACYLLFWRHILLSVSCAACFGRWHSLSSHLCLLHCVRRISIPTTLNPVPSFCVSTSFSMPSASSIACRLCLPLAKAADVLSLRGTTFLWRLPYILRSSGGAISERDSFINRHECAPLWRLRSCMVRLFLAPALPTQFLLLPPSIWRACMPGPSSARAGMRFTY